MKRLRLALVVVCLLGPGSLLAEGVGEDHEVVEDDYEVVEDDYIEIPSGPVTARDERYIQIPTESVDDTYVEIPTRGFSEGSRHGRSVYRELDNDDLDDEPMLQIYPSEDSGLNSLPPTIVPSGEGLEQTVTITPAGEIHIPMGTAEDRVFNRLGGVPEEE